MMERDRPASPVCLAAVLFVTSVMMYSVDCWSGCDVESSPSPLKKPVHQQSMLAKILSGIASLSLENYSEIFSFCELKRSKCETYKLFNGT